MTTFRLLLACCAVCVFTNSLIAAPPDAKTLFPAGGQCGTTVEVTVSGKLDKESQLWSSGEGLSSVVAEKGNAVTLTISPDAIPGVRWLRFHNHEGASALKPFVIGTLPEVIEKEPNDTESGTQRLDTSTVIVNGTLSKTNEVDTFAVPLSQGQTLVASMQANRVLGSPMDAVLQIVSPRGFVLEQNDDDHGFDPQIVFTAAADGTYLVRTFAFPATPNSSVRLAGGADYIYRLTLTTGPFADHAEPLTVRGDEANVGLVGWNLSDELRTVPPTKTPEGFVAWHPQLANVLSLPTVMLPVLVEGALQQPLSHPACITGTLNQPAESDAYLYYGTKDQKLVARVAARRFDSPLDPVLRLIGPDGKLIREVDDSTRNVADPELTATLPAEGDYRVEVTDLHRRGGMRFVYALTIEPRQPDYTLQAGSDRLTVTPGKPAELTVTVKRLNGFDREIEVSLAGLPDGVKAEPVKSEANGKAAGSVKLAVSSEGETAWSGTIRVIGRVADDPERERTATVSIPGTGAETHDLWLTVVKKAE